MINPNLGENLKDRFPKSIEVYTDHGTFTYTIGDFTREPDILRVTYNGVSAEETGNVLSDGEPDFVCFDIHFLRKQDKLKLIINITYGDTIVSEFSLQAPNKLKIGHYEGIGSKVSPDTHFGFSDDTLKALIGVFNSFDESFSFNKNDFEFLDKYFDTYQHNESANIMPLSNDQKILLIDNSKPPQHNFIRKLEDYFRIRGLNYQKISSINEANQIKDYHNIVAIVMSGSDHNIDDSPDKQELFEWAITNFTCPTLAICYAAQSMMRHYGADIYRGKILHDNLKFTIYKDHHLIRGIDCDKYQFSFSFRDFIKEPPEGFAAIAKVGLRVALATNDNKKEYALFFYPENMEFTHKVIDNFIDLIHPAQKEQEKILNGRFESKIYNFNDFLKYNESKK
jgi:GMP synthase-like glutamine amidotransferase